MARARRSTSKLLWGTPDDRSAGGLHEAEEGPQAGAAGAAFAEHGVGQLGLQRAAPENRGHPHVGPAAAMREDQAFGAAAGEVGEHMQAAHGQP